MGEIKFCRGKLKLKLKMKLRQTQIGHQDASGYMQYVKAAAQITLEILKTEFQVSSNTDVVMKSTNKGTHMFMYVFFLHEIAQIPVEQAQNQAQNGFKRTRIGHQGICSM